jgi:putative oxidoreductase
MRANDVALLILRLTMAVVIWPHGAQKALGWFGGPGLAGTVAGMHAHFGIPLPLIYLVVVAEFLGPIALALGILTRLAALGIAIDMVTAAVLAHAQNGFFMNFSGKQPGEGDEFFILLAGIGVALAVAGPGRIAIMKRI